MQPYQAAAEQQRENAELPLRTLAKGAKIGASALAGNFAASKILPFLNPYIPQNLAIKGLSKIDPKLGGFATAAMNQGVDWDETKDFIKKKVTGEEDNAQDNRSVIEQYSPELFNFIKDQVSKGRNVLEAGAIAQINDKFKNVIKKMESDHKTNWSAILQTVFGGGQPAQPEQEKMSQPQAQGAGPGEERLLNVLQMLRQSRGG